MNHASAESLQKNTNIGWFPFRSEIDNIFSLLSAQPRHRAKRVGEALQEAANFAYLRETLQPAEHSPGAGGGSLARDLDRDAEYPARPLRRPPRFVIPNNGNKVKYDPMRETIQVRDTTLPGNLS